MVQFWTNVRFDADLFKLSADTFARLFRRAKAEASDLFAHIHDHHSSARIHVVAANHAGLEIRLDLANQFFLVIIHGNMANLHGVHTIAIQPVRIVLRDAIIIVAIMDHTATISSDPRIKDDWIERVRREGFHAGAIDLVEVKFRTHFAVRIVRHIGE